MGKLANEVKDLIDDVENKEDNTMANVKETKKPKTLTEEKAEEKAKADKTEKAEVKKAPKSELQAILQTLIDAGKLDLRKRKTIQFPCHFTKDFEDTSIEYVTNDTRAINAMKRAQIMTTGQLIERFEEIPRLRNVGTKTVTLLRRSLMDYYYESLEDADKKAAWIKQIVDMNNGSGDPVVEED